jgi:hypothetical protein
VAWAVTTCYSDGMSEEEEELRLACRANGHDFPRTEEPVAECGRCGCVRTVAADGSRSYSYPKGYVRRGEATRACKSG